jgi:patatin-like phospholipase/acyl hydrolase
MFGDTTLSDLERHIVVPSFRLDGVASTTHKALSKVPGSWRPAVFSNLPAVPGVARPDRDLLVRDAALRTSAAPTYFPTVDGYCDGAMFANNPTLVAVSKALSHFDIHRHHVRILSLGAGKWPHRVPSRHSDTDANSSRDGAGDDDWGLKQWAPHLVQLLLDSSTMSTELLTTMMMGSQQCVTAPGLLLLLLRLRPCCCL